MELFSLPQKKNEIFVKDRCLVTEHKEKERERERERKTKEEKNEERKIRVQNRK